MYAEKIYLVGTESGVGVHNAGHIGASVGEVMIDVNGKIINTGTVVAKGNIGAQAHQQIEHSGVLYAQSGNVDINSQQHIQQKGSIVAKGKNVGKGHLQLHAKTAIQQQGDTFTEGDIHYSANQISTDANSVIAAGVIFEEQNNKERKTLAAHNEQGNNLSIQATDQASLQGKHLASNRLLISAPKLNISSSRNQANHIGLLANVSLQAQEQHSYANQSIQIDGPEIYHQCGKIFADQIHIQANKVDNSSGTISAFREFKGDINQEWNNQQGKLLGLQHLSLRVLRAIKTAKRNH